MGWTKKYNGWNDGEGWYYAPPAAGGGITFTPTDAQSAAPAYSAGTFTVNIGTASADRIVLVCFQGHSGTGASTPTINGATMSVAAGSSATADNVTLNYANVPTGTTATIGYGSGMDGVSVAVGILTGQSGGGSATPVNPVTYTASGAQPLSVALTVPSGGIGIACGGAPAGSASAAVFTWTGTTSSTGDETTNSSAHSEISLAHSTSTGTVTVSSTSTLSFGGTMAAAAWAP